MNQKLVTLSGCAGSMCGTADILKINPSELDDIDAGILTLYFIDKLYPGITWGELLAPQQKMGAKWWERIGQNIGDAISDTGDKIGEWGGDAIRLIADDEVRDGIKDYTTAYATGGTSAGIESFLDQIGGIVSGDQKADLLASLGFRTKTAEAPQLIAGLNNNVLFIGGGLLVVLLVLAR